MLYEIIAATVLFLFILFIGLPVSIILISEVERRGISIDRQGLMLCAPAFGVCIITVLIPALYFYLGASEVWAQILAAALVCAAAVSLVLFRSRVAALGFQSIRPGLGLVSALIVGAVFAAPALVSGPEAVVIRTYPSDAFTYITLSENTRVADRALLRDAARSSGSNIQPDTPAAEELAERNPLGLYSARFVDRLRLGTYAVLGWSAHVSQLPVSHVLWMFCGVMSVAAALAALAVARGLGVSRWLSTVGALAATLGYWHFVAVNRENFSTMQVLPIMLAIAFLWPILEDRSRTLKSFRELKSFEILYGAWFSMLIAACFVAYIEMFPFLIAALFVTALISFWKNEGGKRGAVYVITATSVLALFIIVISGQLFHNISVFFAQLNLAIEFEGEIGAFETSEFLSQNLMSALVGVAWIDSALREIDLLWWLAGAVEWVVAFFGAIVIVSMAPMTLLTRNRALRLPYAIMAGGILVTLFGVLREEPYYALKGMPLAAPFAAVLMAAWVGAAREFLVHSESVFVQVGRGSRALGIVSIVPLAVIALFGMGSGVRSAIGIIPEYVVALKAGREYDLSPIVAELERRSNCSLVVSVNMLRQPWWWGAYVVEQTAHYDPIYTSGFLTDNLPMVVVFDRADLTAEAADLMLVEVEMEAPVEEGQVLIEHAGLRLIATMAAPLECRAP